MPAHRARRAGRDDGPPQWPTVERGAPSTRFFTLLFVENPRYRLRHGSSATPQARHVRQGFACAGGSRPQPAAASSKGKIGNARSCPQAARWGGIKPSRRESKRVRCPRRASQFRECLPARARAPRASASGAHRCEPQPLDDGVHHALRRQGDGDDQRLLVGSRLLERSKLALEQRWRHEMIPAGLEALSD